MLKSILIILCLVLFNCSKIVSIDKYNINKGSEEEFNSKEEKSNKKRYDSREKSKSAKEKDNNLEKDIKG